MNKAENFPLLDHIPTGILAIDQDNQIVLWNRMLEQWSGSKRNDLIGKNLFQQFPQLVSDDFFSMIKEAHDSGKTLTLPQHKYSHFIPCRTADGAYRTQLVTLTWLTTHKINLISIQDLTEQQKLIEEQHLGSEQLKRELHRSQALEQEKSLLAAAIDQAGEAVIISDSSGMIQYVNQAFHKQTSWNSHEIKTIMIYQMFSAYHETDFMNTLEALLAKGNTWYGRTTITRKDGSSFPASVSIAPIFNDKRILTHHTIIQEDITKQVLLEENCRNREKQEALVTLIGGIAHDFNNLLTALVGQIYLVAREVKDMPKTALRIKKVQAITQEATENIKQLSSFVNARKLDSKAFELLSFMKSFAILARQNIPESIRLTSDLSDCCSFNGDPHQLQQALLNIIQNSIEALHDRCNGEINISLQTLNASAETPLIKSNPILSNGQYIHIIIHDNGCGIPADMQAHIFAPFFSTKQQGGGLGLAMVLSAVRLHHGIIDVESSPTNGTTFHLLLPKGVNNH
ncbi:MAG: PAS domain S-box protein [Mariprofundus sp.]|nr:PAS domain S-box protein [Mariprofundus sp.]